MIVTCVSVVKCVFRMFSGHRNTLINEDRGRRRWWNTPWAASSFLLLSASSGSLFSSCHWLNL